MKPSEAIKELVKKWENISPGYDNPNIEFQDDSTFISDLTALISEHYYPKEFIDWAIRKDCFNGFPFERNNEGKLILSDTRGMTTKSAVFTADELFNYWEENEQ